MEFIKQRALRSFALSAGLLIFAASACAAEAPTLTATVPPGVELQAQLTAARARWESAAIDNYLYEVTFPDILASTGGDRSTRVTVSDNEFHHNSLVSGWLGSPWNKTVEELFGLVEAAIATTPGRMSVSFEPTYGFPVKLIIDNPNDAPTEETSWEIVSFGNLQILRDERLAKLNTARARWAEHRARRYEFQIEFRCLSCWGPYIVRVSDQEVEDVFHSDGEPADG